jgi:serine protease Do
MTTGATPVQKFRTFSARRLALLAGVAGVSAAVLFTAPGFAPQTTFAPTAAHAQNMQRPVGFADIVEKVKPAVISVRVKINSGQQLMGFENLPLPRGTPMDRFFRRLPEGAIPDELRRPQGRNLVTGQGSGFFITPDGYAVTNNHVVEKAETVEVATDDGKTYSAKVIGTDPRTDLALIKVDGRDDFPTVKFADAAPRIGDWVLAVGNPFGLGGTVTAGIVSARGRDIGAGPYDDFIQIDAPVNRGNSGGPTFDVDGSVIGVNTAIFSPSGGNVGIAFAIPSESAQKVVAELKEKGSVQRGFIGVQIQPVTKEVAEAIGLKEARGALVAEAVKGSPAEKAGIKTGDTILAVEGQPIREARDLSRRIAAYAPGRTVQVIVHRDGQERQVSLEIAKQSGA